MAKSKKHRSRLVLPIIVLLILIGGGIYLLVSHKSKPNNNIYTQATNTTAKRTAATSQPTQIQSQTNANLVAGSAKDENGQTVSSLPPSADWASSANGQITLQEPTASSTIASGSTITGTSSLSQVSFTLTDNSVGLIDQGTLSVVNGRFTGEFAFTTHSSSGKLEVYYSNPSNGAEEDVVEIDINFSTS